MRRLTSGRAKWQRSLMSVAATGVLLSGVACSEPDETPVLATVEGSGAGQTVIVLPTSSAVPGDRQRVVQAVAKALDGVERSSLTPERCAEGNPGGKLCFEVVSDETAMQLGLAVVRTGVPGGGAGTAFFGRTADADWVFWFATEQGPYVLKSLPGDLRACPDGDALVVYSRPTTKAPEVGDVPAGTVLRAEDFVLTRAGTVDGERGDGWYRVSGPVGGWIEARQSADATSGNCDQRDAFERTGTHG